MPKVQTSEMRYLVSLVLIFIHGGTLHAQTPSNISGLPLITNYLPEQYESGHENFDCVQDTNGILYFANSRGVVEYDGSQWREIPTQTGGAVRSLFTASDGRIYVGGYNQLGYLAPDSLGKLAFRSLRNQIQVRRDIKFIWDILEVESTIIFRTDSLLLLYGEDSFEILRSKKMLSASLVSQGRVWVGTEQGDVGYLEKDQIFWLPSDHLIAGNHIAGMLSLADDELIVLTRRAGLFTLNTSNSEAVPSENDGLLEETTCVRILELDAQRFAVASRNGVFVSDQSGQIETVLDTDVGLVSNLITALFKDGDENLWITTTAGISCVSLLSPLSYFDKRNGLEGWIEMVSRYRGDLYVAGQRGLQKLIQNETDKNNRFEFVLGPGFSVHYLLEHDSSLLAAGRAGVFEIIGNKVTSLAQLETGSLLRSKKWPDITFVGLRHGLGYLVKDAEGTTFQKFAGNVTRDIRQMVEDRNGVLWLEPQESGIYRVQFERVGNALTIQSAQLYESGVELPAGWAFLKDFGGEPVVRVGDSIFVPDALSQDLVPVQNYGERWGFTDVAKPQDAQDQQSLWFLSRQAGFAEQDLFRATRSADSRIFDTISIQRIERSLTVDKGIFWEEKGILWHYGMDGLVRQDTREKHHEGAGRSTILNNIIVNDDPISLGLKKEEELASGQNYSFSFSLPYYEMSEENLFQTFLEGYDEDWSSWSKSTEKVYTKIPEGKYTFRVRGKNIHGVISREAAHPFDVFPPWHRSWPAYVVYLCLGSLATLGLVRWRSSQLQQEKLVLQRVVTTRTVELQLSNEKLQKQKLKLQTQAEKLREVDQMKSRLFANISHEFRTPLTLIKGPLDQLDRFPDSTLSSVNREMMSRNADRLLRLVNQLLDLSKLDAGSLPVNSSEGNIYQNIRLAASAFSSLAAERNLDFQIKIPPLSFWAAFDRDHLEKIVYNLLSNAFKFTPNDGSVKISADYDDGHVLIEVKDSGIGIAAKDQAAVFDRFFQVDDSSVRHEEGSGIGLSLVKELVGLMDGTIQLESQVGVGSSFLVRLPMEQILAPASGKEKLLQKLAINLPRSKPISLTEKEKSANAEQMILVVEDNDDMRQFITSQFNDTYRVAQANTGPSGLKSALSNIPDLIVTDLMMPEMDGLQLCELLKSDERTSHIPVIMLTAKAGMENKLTGLETGADVYLTKPFNARELKVQAKNLIEQRTRVRERFYRIDQFNPRDLDWPTIDQQFMQKAMDLLEQRFSDPDFKVPEMQKALVMSKTQLHRKFKALTDQPPGLFLRLFRLKRAAQILKKGHGVSETAFDCGFSSVSYFSKCFKEVHGMSPSEYISGG